MISLFSSHPRASVFVDYLSLKLQLAICIGIETRMPATPPPPLLPSHSSHSIPRASPDSPTGSPRKHRSSFLTRRDSQPEDGYPVSANGTGFNAGLHERRDSGAKWGKEKDAVSDQDQDEAAVKDQGAAASTCWPGEC